MPAHVGDPCVVLAPLRPTGVVQVGGERRDARALIGAIEVGTKAVVVGWDPFGLIVRPASELPEPTRLANHGTVCPSSQELTDEREAQEEEVRRASFWARYGSEVGDRLMVLLPITVVVAAAGWWWIGVPAVAVGASAAVLVAGLLLAWLVLN